MKKQEKEFNIQVHKASGKFAPFSVEKLRNSLKRSGAKPDAINWVIGEIQPKLYDGISTRIIYDLAFKLLKKSSRPVAARYKLKKAIMELGPSGFPFEKFIAGVFQSQGYKTKTGIILQGKCVTHEVDVLAEKEGRILLMECKFHTLQGTNTDVKVPLYIHSRFNDIVSNKEKINELRGNQPEGWVVTNTRFSGDATHYGNCAGLHLLGWDYPKENNLSQMIDRKGLHPITCVTHLTVAEKNRLLERGIVFCMEILNRPELLESAGIRGKKNPLVLSEIKELCN